MIKKPLKFSVSIFITFLCLSFASHAFAAGHNRYHFYDDDDTRAKSLFFIGSNGYFSRYHIAGQERYDSIFAGLAVSSQAQKPSGLKPPKPGPSYPNDPYYWSTGSWGQSYADLWGIKKIGGSAAVWNLYKGDGVKIAIVDTGVLTGQEDIGANMWRNTKEFFGTPGVDDDGDGYVDDMYGWNFVSNNNNPTDNNGHGSHVAGIAAADDNNSKGIIGVAPNATIIPVKVLDQFGSGTIQAVADGIRYAAKVGANIINLSLGAANLDSLSISILQSAVDFARSLGDIVVAAAGNSNSDVNKFSPANLNGVIAVGATDPYDNRAYFSNFGSKLFITAPGVDILSLGSSQTHIGTAAPGTSNYYRASGTSMAAPFVSGAIALLLQKYPGASLQFIQQQLANGAVDLGAPGWDPYYGNGRLNIGASLGVATQTLQTTSSSLPTGTSTSSSSGVSNTALDAQLTEIADKNSIEQARIAEVKTGATLVLDKSDKQEVSIFNF